MGAAEMYPTSREISRESVTRKSQFADDFAAPATRNPARSQRLFGVACSLLGLRAMVLFAAAGCVVPLPYEEAQDGGTAANYPPVIRSATPSMPGPLLIVRNTPQTYTVDIKDNDLDDTLYVRVFRDYQEQPGSPIEFPTATPSGSAIRTVSIRNNFFCNGAADGESLYFDVVVTDRPFIADTTVEPPYRAIEEGAEFSVRSWIAVCQTM